MKSIATTIPPPHTADGTNDNDDRTGHEAAQRDFACALNPVSFRLQLFRSFGIRLTDRQFAALFDIMDINRDR